MKKRLFSILKYLITLSIAAGLLWYIYDDFDVQSMFVELSRANFTWILISLVLAVFSHIARAYRWTLLLEPVGYQIKTFRTFIAVMVGYLANLVIPRMGEVTRCGVIKKTDNISMTASIGTVVGERIIDFLTMLLLIFITVILEFHVFDKLISGFVEDNIALLGKNILLIYLIAGIGLLIVGAAFIFLRTLKERIKRNPFFLKVRSFLREIVAGVTSVRKVKNKAGFVFSTIIIWALYYAMTYVVVFAFPETSTLDLMAGLSLLIMGSLGMTAPVQGGFGTFHAMVATVLLAYGVSEEMGKIFAAVMHTSQVLMIVLVGSLSFIISIFLRRSQKKQSVH